MSELQNPYLWDGTGSPDRDIAEFEQTLRQFRWRDLPLEVPASLVQDAETTKSRSFFQWIIPVAAAVAAVILLVMGISLWRLRWRANAPWSISAIQGDPRINGLALVAGGRLGVGEVLETDALSSAEVRVARIGVMRVEPNSRVELLSTKTGKHRISLERGEISAQLWAPPWSLEMETPSAMAFDLGCKFTLEVLPDGSGLMRVSSGWVELESGDLQTLIPAGAQAVTRKGFAPGSPYYDDAGSEFRLALARLNFTELDPAERDAALATVLQQARAKDVITLFNLMARADGSERARIYDRAAELDPPPFGVTRDGILARDDRMMSRWWAALGLGNAKTWWIHWQDAFSD